MNALPVPLERELALSAHQFEELWATDAWVLNVGGKGSGKTMLDALLILVHSGARPELSEFFGHQVGDSARTIGGLFANDFQQLSSAVMPLVFRWLEFFEVAYVFGRQPSDEWMERWAAEKLDIPRFPAKAYSSMLILENGHHVFCSQLYQQHYKRLKSFEFGYAIVEEASEVDKEALDMVNERVRDTRGRNQIYVHSNPPETDGHWMFEWRDMLRKAQAEGKTSLRELVTTTLENLENLPPGYVDKILATITPEIAQARIYGSWICSASGRAYTGYHDTQSIAACSYDPNSPLIMGFDFNWSPAPAGLFQLTSQGELRKIDEVHIEAGGTEPVCRKIVTNYAGRHRSQVWVYWDATGGSHTANTVRTNHQIVREMIGAAFRPVLFKSRTTNPHEADRVLTVNAALCNARGERWYKIDPRCTRSITDYRRMSWVPGHYQLDKSDLALSHHSDLDGYVICGLRPIQRVSGLSSVRAA